MGKLFAELDDRNIQFIEAQKMYFVATAPSGDEGHVNLSPKGLTSFKVLDPLTVAYLDLVGSGIETTAHLRDNGRIVVMFCAFEGPPRILRLYGHGETIEPGDPDWDSLVGHFPTYQGVRSVIRIRLDRIADSCGYGVPLYRFEGERSQMIDWATRKGDDGIAKYKKKENRLSIDGLPGLPSQD